MLISRLHIFVEELVLIIIFDYWFECVFIKLQHNLFTVFFETKFCDTVALAGL